MGSGLIKENTESVVTEYQLFCTLILKRVLYMTRIDMLNIGVPRMFPKRLGELIFVGGVCPLPPGQGGPGRRRRGREARCVKGDWYEHHHTYSYARPDLYPIAVAS